MIKTILCAVEGWPASHDVLRYAARLARDLSAQLILLHVESEPRGGVLFTAYSPDDPPDEERWNKIASGLLGDPVEVHYATGDAAGRRSFDSRATPTPIQSSSARAPAARRRWQSDSAVGAVLPHAPCPVTVVPAAAVAGEESESEAA